MTDHRPDDHDVVQNKDISAQIVDMEAHVPESVRVPETPTALPPPAGPATELRKVERPSPLTGLANAWLVIVAVFAFGFQQLMDLDVNLRELGSDFWMESGAIVLGVLILIALVALGIGFIQWRTTTFIVDHEFRIEHRFISSSTVRIDFTKVQSVDIHRPLVARVLGLAEVRIDVGGEGGQKLRFLTLERAEALRDHLLARMDGDASADINASSQPTASTHAQQVYKANPANIVLGAIAGFGIVGVIAVIAALILLLTIPGGAPLVVWIAMLGIFWAIPKELLTNWEFTIDRTERGLRIQRGAFTRTQMTLQTNRVQAVELSQSFFMRLLGVSKLRMTVLGNQGSEDDGNIDILMPYGKADEARYVLSLVWPAVDPSRFEWIPQSPRGKRLSWFADHWYAFDGDVLASRHAMLGTRLSIVPHARVQGLGVVEGPLQRLLGLARVVAHTTDGPVSVTIKHLEADDARRLMEEQRVRSAEAREARREPSRVAAPQSPQWAPPSGPPAQFPSSPMGDQPLPPPEGR